jgi:internalin A
MRTILNWKRGSVTLALAVLLMMAATATGQAASPSQTGEVVFNDPYLEEIVRDELNKPEGEITPEDMASLEFLFIRSKRILDAPPTFPPELIKVRDLTGLEWAVNLVVLRLEDIEAADLSPITAIHGLKGLEIIESPSVNWESFPELSDLEVLEIENSNFRDLRPVTLSENLRYLRIVDEIEDLAPLDLLRSLQSLTIRSESVDDITPVGQLISLDYLLIAESRIVDISPLSNLASLRYLALQELPINDISPLESLLELRSLSLSGLLVEDLSLIARLDGLQDLDVSSLPVDALPDLSDLENLEGVGVSNMPSTDLSKLANLSSLRKLRLNTSEPDQIRQAISPGLKELAIGRNDALQDLHSLDGVENSIERLEIRGIPDISGIENLENLTALSAAFSDISDISSLAGLTRLKILSLFSNEITDLSPLVENESFSDGHLDVKGNPLSCEAKEVQVPALKERGNKVLYDGGGECDPPYVDQQVPSEGAVDVPANANVTFHVKDDRKGVEKSSIRITINGVDVTEYTKITGKRKDYLVDVNLPVFLPYGESVEVAIDAHDRSPNQTPMPTFTYSFTTAETHPMVTLSLTSPESVQFGEIFKVKVLADEVEGLGAALIRIRHPIEALDLISARLGKTFRDCSINVLDSDPVDIFVLTSFCDHVSSKSPSRFWRLRFEVVGVPESGIAHLEFFDPLIWSDAEPPEAIPSQGEAIEISVSHADETPEEGDQPTPPPPAPPSPAIPINP